MSKNSVSRGSSNGAVGSEIKFAGNDKEKMYEPKHRRKLVRVLTVVAYVFSVSLAAIMLSLFYMFIYNPGKASEENGKPQGWSDSSDLSALRHFRVASKGSLSSGNETYEGSLEREEPRALPLNAAELSPEAYSEDSLEGKTPFANYSHGYSYENKTARRKILKFLKTQ